jgi:ATP-dependent exoDNAse (exonuclease V) beta subunit
MEKRRATERIRVQDYEARDFSQKIFDIPLVLEAGAGTGKTAALTSRIIAWCLGPGWKRAEDTLGETHKPAELIQLLEAERVAAHVLDGVVAITFTESAAAEMATRVGESLAQIENGALPQGISPESLPPSPGQRRIRSRALLCVLDHLMVGTIHSFCLRLLSEHPLEARLHPDLIVDADGFILEEFVREAVEDQLKTAYSNQGNPHFLALAAAGVGPQDIADALTTLAEAAIPEEVLEEDPFVPQRVRRRKQRF